MRSQSYILFIALWFHDVALQSERRVSGYIFTKDRHYLLITPNVCAAQSSVVTGIFKAVDWSHTMSLPTLKKIAAYGGVLSVLGAGYFFKKIQDGLAAGSYYSQSMTILREHPGASEVLGHPIRSKFLNLGDSFNVVNAAEAKLAIPVKGSKRRGTLYTWSDRQGQGWEVKKLQLQLRDTKRKVTIYAVGAKSEEGDPDNQDAAEVVDD